VDTPISSIPLAMLAVFGTAKLLGEICERIRQPAIAGEILAGPARGWFFAAHNFARQATQTRNSGGEFRGRVACRAKLPVLYRSCIAS
jgi:hypothetical protein